MRLLNAKKGNQVYAGKNFLVTSKVKLENAPEEPSIYGITSVEESEDVKKCVDRAYVNRFILIVPKTWDGILRADRTQNYNCMDSLKPEDIIQENKAIPGFFFEYFMQENMANLLDVSLEETCFFKYTDTNGLSMIYCLL